METTPQTGRRLRLTEENLKKLQPSLIKPMPPMSISSGENQKEAELAADERIVRLKSWVYNAMRTLLDLGSEGQDVVQADELYIAGPGDMRLRGPGEAQEHDKDVKDAGKTAAGEAVGTSSRRSHDQTKADGSATGNPPPPNLDDPAYWEAKLRYLEAKCQPLAQARRKRRRQAPAAAAAEDAARAKAAEPAVGTRAYNIKKAARLGVTLQEVEDAQADQALVEESKLLWRDKQGFIESWVASLPPVSVRMSPLFPRSRTHASIEGGLPPSHPEPVTHPKPPSSGSSIVEISSSQFSHAVGRRQKEPDALVAPAPQETTQAAATGTATEGSARAGLAPMTSSPDHTTQLRERKRTELSGTTPASRSEASLFTLTPNTSVSARAGLGLATAGRSGLKEEMRSTSPTEQRQQQQQQQQPPPPAACATNASNAGGVLGKRRRPGPLEQSGDGQDGPAATRPCLARAGTWEGCVQR